MAKDPERRFAAATGFGLTVARAMLQNQVFLLRLWADNIERFAQVYDDRGQALRSGIEQELHRERAA
jgi:hypothetical protein